MSGKNNPIHSLGNIQPNTAIKCPTAEAPMQHALQTKDFGTERTINRAIINERAIAGASTNKAKEHSEMLGLSGCWSLLSISGYAAGLSAPLCG